MKATKDKIRAMGQKKASESEKKEVSFYSKPIYRNGKLVPTWILNEPNYKKIMKLDQEVKEMSDEFLQYCQYLVKVQKMISKTKKEIKDESRLAETILKKRAAISKSPKKGRKTGETSVKRSSNNNSKQSSVL